MKFHPSAVESFAKKLNLTEDQLEFDRQITSLFPGGQISGHPVLGLVPVPLGFGSPDDLSALTDGSIVRKTIINGERSLHPAEYMAWLTITPIPTVSWSAKKLRHQKVRWHAELCRTWEQDGWPHAGRRWGGDNPNWDLSKNPLQDPYRIRPHNLLPGEFIESPTYGTLSIDTSELRTEIRVGDQPVFQIRTADMAGLELCLDTHVHIGAVLATNTTDHAIVIGRVQLRNGAPILSRDRRDHLSATRQTMLVRAASRFFELVRSGERTTDWPTAYQEGAEPRRVNETLKLDDTWSRDPSVELLRWLSGMSQRFSVASVSQPFRSPVRGIVRHIDETNCRVTFELPGSDGWTEISGPPSSAFTCRVGEQVEAGQQIGSFAGRALAIAMSDRKKRHVWATAVRFLLVQHLLVDSLLPYGVLPFKGMGARTLVSTPYRREIDDLAVLVYDWPVWHEFDKRQNGIVWQLKPTDARFRFSLDR